MPLVAGASYAGVKLDDEQVQNATIAYNTAKSLGASDRDIQTMWVTMKVEAQFRNPRVMTDHDSLGAFQQRAAWGSVEARTNVATATTMFFQGGAQGQEGLFDKKNRNSMSIGAAAQSVQVSAFPARYEVWVPMSAAMITAMGGVPNAAVGGGTASSAGFTDALGGIGDAIGFLVNPGNWLRLGLFVFGMGLLVMGALKAMGKSEAVQDTIKGAVGAVALKGKA